MHARDKTKLYKTIGFLALAGILLLSLLTKCSNSARMPDDRDLEEIFKWSLPRIYAVSSDGTEAELSDKAASLVNAKCWPYQPGSVSERRYPKPKYDCVFWFDGSDGKSYATVLYVEYIPESTVFTNAAGRRLDFANVGRYQITAPNREGLRNTLRRLVPDYLRADSQPKGIELVLPGPKRGTTLR